LLFGARGIDSQKFSLAPAARGVLKSKFSFGAFGAQGTEVKFFRWRLRRACTEVAIFL
jgi:hypothetical protein